MTSFSSALRGTVATGFVGALAMAGCSSDAPRPDDEVATSSDAITGGSVDTAHAAVMLENCDKACFCTGTMVKKDEATGVGFILTAAHCIPTEADGVRLRYFVQGNKVATFGSGYASKLEPGTIRYPVLDAVRHPEFDGALSFDGKQAHDFGIVRVLGVSATTPVLELGTENDGLKKDSPVMSIGYGSTGAWSDEKNLGEAGTRHVANVKVDAITANFITVSGKDSGGSVNIGDSGGPVVASVEGVERVVGIHSAGVENLIMSVRQSGRVSADLTWIQSELAKAPPVDSCKRCLQVMTGGTRTCAPQAVTCVDNVDCNGYALCLEGCAAKGDQGPTQACRDECKAGSAAGATSYESTFKCACGACAAQCGDTCPAEYLTPPAPDAGSPSPATPSDGSDAGVANAAAPASEGGCNQSGATGDVWPMLVVLGLVAKRRARGRLRTEPCRSPWAPTTRSRWSSSGCVSGQERS